MKYIALIVALVLAVCGQALSLGLTISDYIDDYNYKFGATWFSCSEVSEDFYSAIDQNFQMANLQMIAIKTGRRNPLTGLDGHRIVTYTRGRFRYVISTFPTDESNREFEVREKDMGTATLHEVCTYFVPDYRYVTIYRKGFGWIPKSRTLLMNECGHHVEPLDDIWERTGKTERPKRTPHNHNIWRA